MASARIPHSPSGSRGPGRAAARVLPRSASVTPRGDTCPTCAPWYWRRRSWSGKVAPYEWLTTVGGDLPPSLIPPCPRGYRRPCRPVLRKREGTTVLRMDAQGPRPCRHRLPQRQRDPVNRVAPDRGHPRVVDRDPLDADTYHRPGSRSTTRSRPPLLTTSRFGSETSGSFQVISESARLVGGSRSDQASSTTTAAFVAALQANDPVPRGDSGVFTPRPGDVEPQFRAIGGQVRARRRGPRTPLPAAAGGRSRSAGCGTG